MIGKCLRLDPRWKQLLLGLVVMAGVANLQYGWTLFVGPMDAGTHWGKASIQVAFSIFILVQTWFTPIEGRLIDKYGPRTLLGVAGLCIPLGWGLNSVAHSLWTLYAGAAISGLGVGVATTVAYGNAMKWFSAKRGRAVGLTAAGFGVGGMLTIGYLERAIVDWGYREAFLLFGVLQGGVLILASFFIKAPELALSPAVPDIRRDYRWQEAMLTPAFWTMYLMFVLVAAGGLMVVAQLAPMAHDYGVADVSVGVLGFFAYPALIFALKLNQLMNGLSRVLFGELSDRLGREKTMCIAFAAEGTGIFLLAFCARDPLLFVLLSGAVFFAWGEIFSLFPAVSADFFGRRNAAANYGWLYTAKGVASLLVPLSSWLVEHGGGWNSVLYAAGTFDLIAAFLALYVLLPLRRRMKA